MSDRYHPSWRRPKLVGVGAVLALVPIAGLSTLSTVAWSESSRPIDLSTIVLFGSGTFTTPNSTSKAITYQPDLAPIGGAMTATVVPTSEGSTADVTVFGVLPNRGYAVSAHTKACGAAANAAGARFEYLADPTALSRTAPRESATNPVTEISLTVRTDATGAGTARITVPFTLTDLLPRSMVLHDGTQRDLRVACLTLTAR